MVTKSKVSRKAGTVSTFGRHPFEPFDVTIQQVVGRVEPGDGDLSAHEAAFLVVARYDTEGTYSWKNGDHEVKLTVEYPEHIKIETYTADHADTY